MGTNPSIRDRYPILSVYGNHHEFLDNDAALDSTVEGRIRSVWPFLVNRVLAFQKTLKPRERVNFDCEDIIAELWIAIARKDGQWTPERGRYITFAGMIIDRELCSIRDKSRTVQSPRNSSCRLKAYRSEEEAGTLTDRRRQTANDILRTAEGALSIACRGTGENPDPIFEPTILDDPADNVIARETADETRAMLEAAMRRLAPVEAEVIASLAGLWGKDPLSATQVATKLGRKRAEVIRIKDRAVIKLRKHLGSRPAAA